MICKMRDDRGLTTEKHTLIPDSHPLSLCTPNPQERLPHRAGRHSHQDVNSHVVEVAQFHDLHQPAEVTARVCQPTKIVTPPTQARWD